MKMLVLITVSLWAPVALCGAWGNGPFENDDAADWLYELEGSGVSAVTNALERVKGNTGYIEAPECSVAIAAAEVVAAALGKPHQNLPSSVQSWLSGNNAVQLRSSALLAQEALQLCLSPSKSELRQLWGDSEEMERDWLNGVRLLEGRLGKEVGK